ncbi:MAG TPA: gluconokinase, GntK/IdnK-type [Streptosporangiaceae bacterium]
MTAFDQVQGRHLVVMGVAGAGKSTVGRLLADRLGMDYADADDFHAADAIAKMRQGFPLTDTDRGPWLGRVGTWLRDRREGVVSCSALRRSYRDRLRGFAPDCFFLHLSGAADVVVARVRDRNGHFMPASLVASQYSELEPLDGDELGTTVDLGLAPSEIVDRVTGTDSRYSGRR